MKEQIFQHIVLIYLAVINVVTFFMYGIDKWKAKKSKWRIRETALLGLAVLGGSIGAWLGPMHSYCWSQRWQLYPPV